MEDDVPFEALRELWGDYTLPNGIRIRARPSIAYLSRVPESEDLSMRFETSVVVAAPQKHQGTPEDSPEDPSVREAFQEFERGQLPRSFYLVDDKDLLIVKAYPERILWYDGFHDTGQPMMRVEHAVAVEALEGAAAPLGEPPNKAD